MKFFLFILIFIIVPTFFIESNLKSALFKKVKYTNVNEFDAKIDLYSLNEWNALFIGSSEVHWGISPTQFEKALDNEQTKSFNFGLNGMTIDRYFRIFPYLNKTIFNRKQIKTIFIGLNLTEPRTLNEGKLDCNRLGSFEKPIYLSSFAKDSNLYYDLCDLKWTAQMLEPIEKFSHIFRYRQSIREYIFRRQKNTDISKLHLTEKGFHYRKSLKDDTNELELTKKWFSDIRNYRDDSGYNINEILKPDGLLSKFIQKIQKFNIKVVLFNNPTNPKLIKLSNGHLNFSKNYKKISEWAKQNNTVFLDVKEVREFDSLKDFADRRHLSETGAKKFSLLLGKMYKDYLTNSK